MTVPREGESICPTGAVRLLGRRGVVDRNRASCTWSGKGHCTWCDKPVPSKGRRTLWCSQWCVDAFHATQPERQREALEERDGGVCVLCGLDTVLFCRVVRRYWRITRERQLGPSQVEPTVTRESYEDFNDGRFGLTVAPPAQGQGHIEQLAALLTLRGHPTSLRQLGQLIGDRRRWWDMDHTIPISEGGHPYDPRNLRTLCFWCHARVTSEGAARRADQRRRVKQAAQGQVGLFGDPC